MANNQKTISQWLVIAGLAMMFCGLLPQQGSASHPFHVSSAEVYWNPKTGNFEVALCVWPADLEKAIAQLTGKPTDLDQVNEIDVLMTKYVASRFVISKIGKSKPYSSQSIRWVGHEMNLKNAWLYFEVGGDQSPGKWRVENRLFFELNDDQINQVQLDMGGPTQSISLSQRKSFAEVDTNNSGIPFGAVGKQLGR